MLTPRVPFEVDTWFGFGTLHGVLRLDGQTLVVETQTRDSIAGAVKTDVVEVRVPLGQLDSAVFNKGWLGFFASITLTGATLSAMQAFPNAEGLRVSYDVARGDRANARELVSTINLLLSEIRMRASQVPSLEASSQETRDSSAVRERLPGS